MRSALFVALLMMGSPVLAADEDRSANGAGLPKNGSDDADIIVIAERIAGQIDTDIPPVMVLDEADIAAYGASSIGDLLAAVSPQTGSGRGRGGGHPVILINGQRISSFRQLRHIPPEAIRRMEVLPEEVALRFGHRPDQRVVNFILKDKFSSIRLAGEYNLPTSGGFAESELEGGLVRFKGPSRINLNAKVEDVSLLTEAQRDILQTESTVPGVDGDPDPAVFRSLINDSVTHTVTGSWSTGLGAKGLGGSLTLDGELSRKDARSLFGLDTVILTGPGGDSHFRALPGSLERDVRTDNFEAGLSLNKQLGSWQLTVTGDAVYTDVETRTDREADLTALEDAALAGILATDGAIPAQGDPGRDHARTKLLTLSAYAGLTGKPLSLPAGAVSLTLDADYDHLDNRSTNSRQTAPLSTTRLSRDILSAGANLAVPIAGGKAHFLDAVGDISLNFSGELHHLSDFGTLYDWSAGVIWSPTKKLTLNASYIVSEVAPSVGQLGNAQLATFNVPTYDFTLGEAALVTVITGGNPSLLAEKQRDIKLSANYTLPFFSRSSMIVEYFCNRSDNVTRSFPLLTPQIEAAFPDRVIRDGNGNLVQIDSLPVTFSNVRSDHLRWGINLSGKVASSPKKPASRSKGGMPFGRRGHGGRWNVALYHTWRFGDEVTIAPGLDTLNQLAGDSLIAGGVPRHELELEGGIYHKGFGVRLNGRWTAPAIVLASGGPGSADLRFGSVTNLDMRFFINLGSQPGLVKKMPFLKGVRLAFDFDNILNSPQKVTDGDGLVPIAYQRGYNDPRGRFAGIDIKKSF